MRQPLFFLAERFSLAGRAETDDAQCHPPRLVLCEVPVKQQKPIWESSPDGLSRDSGWRPQSYSKLSSMGSGKFRVTRGLVVLGESLILV